MGHKDHLETVHESLKFRDRNFKRIISSNYQGNPPTLTNM